MSEMRSEMLASLLPVTLPSDQDSTGRTLGDREIEFVTEALRSGTLTSTKGTFVRRLELEFAAAIGTNYAYACSSGSAAIHAAISAIDPEPGDEIITSAITDMGALTPILYQSAIPVFADVDPKTLNITAAAIASKISPRTKGIVVTHLFGNPCDMDPILALAGQHNIPVIEDCAQAFLASYRGRTIGTLGTMGCFSMQQGKHMTCGEGGLVTTDDDELARRVFLFVNKCFGYGDPAPDHYYLALNSRLSEIQGAVALGQLEKLPSCVASRQERAAELTAQLEGINGITPFPTVPGGTNVYWKFCLQVDSSFVRDGAVGLARALKERGISSSPRYIQKPAFECEIFQKRRTFGSSQFPFTLARPEVLDYRKELYPGTYSGLEHTLVLPWNENYLAEHVTYIADSIREAIGNQ